MLVILVGSASLKRKNTLQVPKRELPPPPHPGGPLTCPSCGLEGFLRRGDQRRGLGTPMKSAGHSVESFLLVKTTPKLSPAIRKGIWSCHWRVSTTEQHIWEIEEQPFKFPLARLKNSGRRSRENGSQTPCKKHGIKIDNEMGMDNPTVRILF